MSDKEIVNSNETPILKDVVKGAFGSSTSAGDTSGFGGLVTTIQAAPSAQKPYGSYFDEIADALEKALPTQKVTFEQAIERVVVQVVQQKLKELHLVISLQYPFIPTQVPRDAKHMHTR